MALAFICFVFFLSEMSLCLILILFFYYYSSEGRSEMTTAEDFCFHTLTTH